ncbi:protein Lines homolog 1 isoform X2 [Sphaeramia orbicularis]|uniref:protein Lines homolog 1 isoform X2 n=1 Tax=Sphaeramia orbicularis TaxID=375764 RepID=UPI00117ED8CE|nr:protein Lines homolog 1 isoform X2 [Sphaeramia orbicularis]
MEPYVEPRAVEEEVPFDCVSRAYRCVLSGLCPGPRAEDLVHVILSGMCGAFPADCCHGDAVALSCVCVSLVDQLVSGSTRPGTDPYFRQYAELCVTKLRERDVMTQLVQLFQAEDQIVRHVSAKTASTCVLDELRTTGTLCPVWVDRCVQVFLCPASSADLDACLWSLTDVLRRLQRGHRPELTEKLVEAFDSSVSSLCSSFLADGPEDSGTMSCLVLDLLEVLSASGTSLRSQRIISTHSPALLRMLCCSRMNYFTKKQVVLLLKRALLENLGEDWSVGGRARFERHHADLNELSHHVLQTATPDWFGRVEVQPASFFGGTSRVRGGEEPDGVMLRSISLVLLKSMVLQIQDGPGLDWSSYLDSLWSFLRRFSVQLMEATHRCSWFALLFGDQDDDMMEAANGLLCIFLRQRSASQPDGSSVLDEACSSGCNPHCIFLLLLQSVAFDHSVLLDFLISTETCFLEYFVHYLKFLRTDGQGFTSACIRMSAHHCPQFHPPRSSSGSGLHESNQPTALVCPVGGAGLTIGLCLVDYDGSDESDPENMDVSESLLTTRTSMDQHVEQSESSDSMGLTEPGKAAAEPPAGPNLEPLPGPPWTQTTHKAIQCLSELRALMVRLHMKNLFPYNPSSLLKLLEQVETDLTSSSR